MLIQVGQDLFVAVISNGLNRAAFEGFHAKAHFLFGRGLLVHKGITALVVAGKETRRCLTAKIAINALLIDVKFTAGVLRPFVCFVGHTQRVKERIGRPCQAASQSVCDIFSRTDNALSPENLAGGLYSRLCERNFRKMPATRSYQRDEQRNYRHAGTSALTWLLALITAGFVLQNIFLRWFNADAIIASSVVLTPDNIVAGKIWTLFTYSFVHSMDSFPYLLHVVGNLTGIYFLGRELIPVMGERRFVGLFIASVLGGGLVWTATHWQTGGVAMGATAGLLGLLVAYAGFFPQRQVTFLLLFIFPITIKPKLLTWGVLGLELCGFIFYEILGAASPFEIAHSAHLGGMLVGWIYFQYLHDTEWQAPWGKAASEPLAHIPPEVTDTPAALSAPTNRATLRIEIDRILDKINSEGFGSLTDAEKRVLDEAKDLLSRR